MSTEKQSIANDKKAIEDLLAKFSIDENKYEIIIEECRYDILFSLNNIQYSTLIFRVRTCEDGYLARIERELKRL